MAGHVAEGSNESLTTRNGPGASNHSSFAELILGSIGSVVNHVWPPERTQRGTADDNETIRDGTALPEDAPTQTVTTFDPPDRDRPQPLTEASLMTLEKERGGDDSAQAKGSLMTIATQSEIIVRYTHTNHDTAKVAATNGDSEKDDINRQDDYHANSPTNLDDFHVEDEEPEYYTSEEGLNHNASEEGDVQTTDDGGDSDRDSELEEYKYEEESEEEDGIEDEDEDEDEEESIGLHGRRPAIPGAMLPGFRMPRSKVSNESLLRRVEASEAIKETKPESGEDKVNKRRRRGRAASDDDDDWMPAKGRKSRSQPGNIGYSTRTRTSSSAPSGQAKNPKYYSLIHTIRLPPAQLARFENTATRDDSDHVSAEQSRQGPAQTPQHSPRLLRHNVRRQEDARRDEDQRAIAAMPPRSRHESDMAGKRKCPHDYMSGRRVRPAMRRS